MNGTAVKVMKAAVYLVVGTVVAKGTQDLLDSMDKGKETTVSKELAKYCISLGVGIRTGITAAEMAETAVLIGSEIIKAI